MRLHFEGDLIRLGDEIIDKEIDYKVTWRKVKNRLQKATESKRNLRDERAAKPSVSSARRRVPCMVKTESTWTKDIINHDDIGTDGRDKGLESSKRTGTREAMSSMQGEMPSATKR